MLKNATGYDVHWYVINFTDKPFGLHTIWSRDLCTYGKLYSARSGRTPVVLFESIRWSQCSVTQNYSSSTNSSYPTSNLFICIMEYHLNDFRTIANCPLRSKIYMLLSWKKKTNYYHPQRQQIGIPYLLYMYKLHI